MLTFILIIAIVFIGTQLQKIEDDITATYRKGKEVERLERQSRTYDEY